MWESIKPHPVNLYIHFTPTAAGCRINCRYFAYTKKKKIKKRLDYTVRVDFRFAVVGCDGVANHLLLPPVVINRYWFMSTHTSN